MDKRCLGPRQTLPRVACYFCARRGRGEGGKCSVSTSRHEDLRGFTERTEG